MALLGCPRFGAIGVPANNCQNVEIAKIPIDRSVAAGGGYTIGAWEYVFTDVAERLVQDLEKNVLKK